MSRLLRRGTRAVVLVTLLLGFTVGARAHEGDESLLHACVKRENGQLRLVLPDGRCLPSEVAVDWSQGTGVSAPSAASSAFFEVVDREGAVVGPVVAIQSSYPVVGLKANGVPFVLFLVGDTLYGTGAVYFESATCSPPGYVEHAFATLAAAGVDPQGQVYVEDRAAADVPLSVRSVAYGGQCYVFSLNVAAPPGILGPRLGAGPYQVR